MKNYIHKINRFLIERYPNIWNTKIVWMLGINLVLHLLFYGFGFNILSNINLLHESGVIDIFFDNGTFVFGVLISIVVIFIWLLNLFKNNSFKNFYPTSGLKLFGQFFMYFIIILSSITFYYSYTLGLKHHVNLNYPDTEFAVDIDAANNAGGFLSHSLYNYTINQKVYPKPFDSLFCVTKSDYKRAYEAVVDSINYNTPYTKFYDKSYQFYTLKTKTISKNESIYDFKYLYHEVTDSTYILYIKDKVVDITQLGYNAEPTYYNYSKIFFNESYHSLANDYYTNNAKKRTEKEDVLFSKKNIELLNRNDPSEIKTTLDEFLKLCDKFKIEHNLTTEQWLSLVYHPKDFKIKSLIQNRKPIRYSSKIDQTELEKHIDTITTKYYITSGDLHSSLENIDEIKKKRVLDETVNVFLWIAFSLALLIFLFRITDLKTFIFTLISGVLIIILTCLVFVLFEYLYLGNIEYFGLYFMTIVALTIISVPFLFLKKLKKIIGGIFINLSLVSFTITLVLIMAIVYKHVEDYCRFQSSSYKSALVMGDTTNPYIQNCTNYVEDIGLWWSPIIFILSLIFIYLYSHMIKRWKALPNG